MQVHPFESRLAKVWPPEDWRDVTVLLAVSGGADSIALLRAVGALKGLGGQGGGDSHGETGLREGVGFGSLVVAHFDHRLRGEQSAGDERFVIELSRRFGLRCEVGRATDLDRRCSEDDARAARFAFFEQTAGRVGARYVATAHTADDQAETILHRIVRGTGIGGLAGMARTRPLGPATLIRPLLDFRRADLLEYLEQIGQPFRTDRSNTDRRYTRNRIRHELLPHLAEQFNPQVADALLRLGTLAGEAQATIDRAADELLERCLLPGRGVAIDTASLASQPAYLVREVLMALWRRQQWPMQAMGFAKWEQLAEMARAAADPGSQGPSKHTFPGGVLAEAVPGRLRFSRDR